MLYASDVKIPDTLSGAISGFGSPGFNASNAISANYAKAKGQFGQDASARGMRPTAATGPGSYAGSRFDTTKGLDVGNLESALAGGLGNTAYQDTQAQREFNQNSQLAQLVGSLNKPDLLQQILGGVGSIGGTAAQIYGAMGKNNKKTPPSPNSIDDTGYGATGYDPEYGYYSL